MTETIETEPSGLGGSDPDEAVDSAMLLERPTSLWRGAWKRLLRRKTGVAGLFIIGSLLLVAIFAPLIAPHDPTKDFIDEGERMRRDPPCVHVFGCDEAPPSM